MKWTVPVYPVATLSDPSSAVTVNPSVAPAVVVVEKPDTLKCVALPGSTVIPVWFAVKLPSVTWIA